MLKLYDSTAASREIFRPCPYSPPYIDPLDRSCLRRRDAVSLPDNNVAAIGIDRWIDFKKMLNVAFRRKFQAVVVRYRHLDWLAVRSSARSEGRLGRGCTRGGGSSGLGWTRQRIVWSTGFSDADVVAGQEVRAVLVYSWIEIVEILYG